MISKEQPVTSTVLVSIGADAATLAAFKYHAGLDTDPSWTEADGLLQSYLLSAEKYINKQVANPYREMVFTQRFIGMHWDRCVYRYYLVPSFWPLKAGSTSMVGVDNTGTVTNYVENTDYVIAGGPKPAIVMNYAFVLPCYDQVLYPWTLSYTAGGLQDEMQRTTIFQLAAYYQRFPEAVHKDVPDSIFSSHLDALNSGGFL